MFEFLVAYSLYFVPLGSNTVTKCTPRHLYQTHSKSRAMGDVEEVQEQMKADMSALKDQMASMMEAMLDMKRLIESNAATAAATSTVVEADPILPSTANLAHQLAPNMVGQGRDTLGNTNSSCLGYNRSAYPYGLPPKEETHWDPCLMHPGASHDMETCSAVEQLLQRMIDQGRLEIGDEDEKEQHVCM